MPSSPDPQATIRRVSMTSLIRSAIVTVGVVGVGLLSVTVLAQTGRATYRYGQTASQVTFNAVIDNPTHGDERNFVLIRPAGTGEFVDTITVQPGQEYDVYSYVHNNADSALNATGRGLATGVRLSASVPSIVQPQQPATIRGTLTADNALPQSISDDVTVVAIQPTTLQYVKQSAVIHSNGPVNGSVVGDTIVTPGGAAIGYERLNGVVPAGAEHAGYVMYRLKAVEADCDVVCPSAAITELPRTGVEQTVSLVMSTMLLVAAVIYYVASRRAVRRSVVSSHTTTKTIDSPQ